MIYGIIPARLESTRLPRKMLLAETGKPLLWHTWNAAKQCPSLDEVIVATDSDEIADVVRWFGGRVELTGEHASGTDRVAEVARRLPDAEIVVNIQGDEPELPAGTIAAVVECLKTTDAEIVTVAADMADHPFRSLDIVKVRMRSEGQPEFCRTYSSRFDWRHHVGIYGFRAEALHRATAMPRTELEICRRLEQLRWVDAGFRWGLVNVPATMLGIDTHEDYSAFVERMRHGTSPGVS